MCELMNYQLNEIFKILNIKMFDLKLYLFYNFKINNAQDILEGKPYKIK